MVYFRATHSYLNIEARLGTDAMSKFTSLSLQKLYTPFWVLLFCLVGFTLRVQQLDFQPLWGDEGWSFYLALHPLFDLLALTAIDIHPPLYYILLKVWLSGVGVGAEEARLFSVVVGTLLIPTAHGLGNRLFNRMVGLISAGIIAVMPMAVYYAQEVRMYGLVTLLGALSLYWFIRLQREPSNRTVWLGYLLTTTAAFYTHYFAAFIIFAQLLASLPALFGKSEHQKSFLQIIAPFSGVGLLYLPWLAYLGSSLTNYVENKRDVEGYLPLNIFEFMGDHFVAFSLGHLPPAWGAIWGTLPFILIASLGFLVALYFNRNKPYRYIFLYLFIPLILGFGVNLIFPFNPLYFERTLLLAAPAYWIFIGAGLGWLWNQSKLVGTFTMLGLVSITAINLFGFYTTPRYIDEDYRPLLQDIQARATEADTILASYQWQLGFYQAYLSEPRPRLFIVPEWGAGWAETSGEPQRVADLQQIFDTSPRLWFPAYQASGHIWEDEAETTIASLGYPTLLQWYSPETKLTLTYGAQENLVDGPTANFANRLSIVESQVGQGSYEAGRGIIPVSLIWQKKKSLGSAYRVSLRLVDQDGRTWASRDSHPQGNQKFFTDLALGEVLADRHGLLISAGTPPGEYNLLLSVRRVDDAAPLDLLDEQGQPMGAELLFGAVTIVEPQPPIVPSAFPVQHQKNSRFGETVELVGYSLGHGPYKAGQRLPLTLFWHSLVDQPDNYTISIQLQNETGELVVDHQQRPIQPTDSWQTGTILRDPHDVVLPPTLSPGQYRLLLTILSSEQAPLIVEGYEQLLLEVIETIDRPRNFEPPSPQTNLSVNFGNQAKLIGVDVPHLTVQPGDSMPITLYWQGIALFDRSWAVFVHLIDEEGQIISQQDQIPGGGQFPTTSWLPNEYLSDAYQLQIPSDIAAKPDGYRIRVGLYDVQDFTRLPVLENDEIVNDHVILDNFKISVQ